jgi:dolichol-phosphate mannosyltransferase
MFNERTGAERCVREIARVLSTVPNRVSLIIVNDGSADGTAEVLAAMRAPHPALEVVTHSSNRGYGAALATGAARAAALGFEYALFMDSDLTNDPRDIPRFAEQMLRGADVIKASRYTAGGQMVGVPWQRALVSWAGNVLARALFRLPLRDCTNGFRAVRTSLLTRMDLRERGFPVIMEELYWCRFLASSFAEVPVTLTNAGRASSFRYRPSVFASYLRYPWRAFLGRAPNERRDDFER